MKMASIKGKTITSTAWLAFFFQLTFFFTLFTVEKNQFATFYSAQVQSQRDSGFTKDHIDIDLKPTTWPVSFYNTGIEQAVKANTIFPKEIRKLL